MTNSQPALLGKGVDAEGILGVAPEALEARAKIVGPVPAGPSLDKTVTKNIYNET